MNKLFSVFKNKSYWLLLLPFMAATGCQTAYRPGTPEPRAGDEIVIAGRFVHTGTPVVLWLDPGGYDAYRVEKRFGPFDQSSWRDSSAANKELTSPNRYGLREKSLTPAQIEKVRGGGWDLPLLQTIVDQFVYHFDNAGTSRQCFKILQDERDLSVHFMLDIDGTLYQTLDLKERAWHATSSNTRSVGIEIAHPGAYPKPDAKALKEWYVQTNGQTTLVIPARFGDGGVRTPNFVGHPARPNLIEGKVQGEEYYQYDYTPQQYAALVKLTATLCNVFPKLPCRYPTDSSGNLITHKLPDDVLNHYEGVLGHYHIQTNKEDPGPAFNWDYVVGHARKYIHHGFSPMADSASMGHERERF